MNNVDDVVDHDVGGGSEGAAAADDDVKCNDPNCLRCQSFSQRHIQAFHSNVVLLRRLVKLEPQIFDGMREEIWSVIEDKLLSSSSSSSSSTSAMLMSRGQESSSNSIFEEWNNHRMVRFWAWMRRLSLMYSLPASSSSSSTTQQAGQDPTVFFLPGLMTTPVHDENHCPAGENCPCIRLWKKTAEGTDKSSKKYRPILSMTGDIIALQHGYDIIRRELLEFLSYNDNECDDHDQSSEEVRVGFQLFDPKVYTHAGSNSRSSQNGDENMTCSNSGQARQQQEQKPEWSSIYLYHRGVRQSNLCDKYFPQTMSILETQCSHRMAGKCGLGAVYFSKLGRNTKVKEHCGPTNIRWRCHLPLIVPRARSGSKSSGDAENGDSSSCSSRESFLRVGLTGVNERCIGWEEGTPILFDDSFLHSAIHYGCDTNNTGGAVNEYGIDDNRNSGNIFTNNNLDGARIVLIVDFWHPSLSEMDRAAFGVLYPPGS